MTMNSIQQLATYQLKSATPTFADMVGAPIRYVYARPYQRLVIVETGVIIGWQHHRNGLYMRVQPNNKSLSSKWIHEDDFMSYVQGGQS